MLIKISLEGMEHTASEVNIESCPLVTAAAGGICPCAFEIPLHAPCHWNKSPPVLTTPPVAESNLHFQMGTRHNGTVGRGLLKIKTRLIKARVKESGVRPVTERTEMDRVRAERRSWPRLEQQAAEEERDTLIYLRLNLVFNVSLRISDDSLTPIHQHFV